MAACQSHLLAAAVAAIDGMYLGDVEACPDPPTHVVSLSHALQMQATLCGGHQQLVAAQHSPVRSVPLAACDG